MIEVSIFHFIILVFVTSIMSIGFATYLNKRDIFGGIAYTLSLYGIVGILCSVIAFFVIYVRFV